MRTSERRRQAQVINSLTIVATDFLPLSFLTGYFGMNFRILMASFKLTPLHDASWRQPRPVDGRDRAGIGASESTVGLRKRSTRSDPLDLNRVSSRLPERVNDRMLTSGPIFACVAAQESRICRQFAMGRAGIEPATLGLRVPCSTS